jgi:2-polyprenyl-3-methyl-5-hydroxy-6-metoxy-1,4-benzoquinol methylase
VPALGRVLPALVDAFRTGAGVPYADYAIHDAQGDFNRPAFLTLLPSQWLPAVHGLVDRLTRPGARVAEIGCGEGWAAIGIAQAFPTVHVDGFDLDEASVAAARKHAANAGVADRVRFEVADVTRDLGVQAGGYDLVLALEMIHDLARPREALATMRALGAPDAVVLVMDENAAESFEPSTENPVERLLYAFSVLHCLPVGRVEAESAATGTVMRLSTFNDYAVDAGFSEVEVLPIEHDLFRFYRLHP